MTADDLRALSAAAAAATPAPWDGHRHTIFEPIDDAPLGEAGAEVADVDHPEDLELIVWLRNHADALADLIDATDDADDKALTLGQWIGRINRARAALDADR